jgi:cellulose synthase operon protein C
VRGGSHNAPRPPYTTGVVTNCFLATVLAVLALSPQSADLAGWSQAGADAMKGGRYDEAAQIYRQLVQAVPNDPGLLMNLGMALAMGGHEDAAVGPLERAVALKPVLTPAQLFLGSSYLALGAPEKAIAPLKRAAAAEPTNIEYRRLLARAYAESGRSVDAATELRRVTELAPRLPAAWYALFHAYNAVAQDALGTFVNEPANSRWQALLLADALSADGKFTDAFAIYRETLEAMPSMVSIHDSLADIYDKTGHADWAATERAKGRLTPVQCAKRKPLCEFRAGRHRAALVAALSADSRESHYWRARAATELSRAAFAELDRLPDSRERRELRAILAAADRRHPEAVTELKAALKYAPDDPNLLGQLGVALYLSREYEQAAATLGPLVKTETAGDDAKQLTAYGDSLLQLDRVEEAIPFLRRAFTADTSDPDAALALARAYVRRREFSAALPLLEWQLAGDADGSVHIQLSRALAGLGQQDKAEAMLAKAQDIQRAAQERAAGNARRAITPPK